MVVDFGMGAGSSSSSLESTNLLRNAGALSSSSLESANLLDLCGKGFDFAGFDDEERPKPGRRIGDFVRSGLLFRRDGPESCAFLIDRRICVGTGCGPALKGRRFWGSVGDMDRRLNLLEPIGDVGRAPPGCSFAPRMDRRNVVISAGFARLKLLLLSPDPLRRRGAVGAAVFFAAADAEAADKALICIFTAAGSGAISDVAGNDMGRDFLCSVPLGSDC